MWKLSCNCIAYSQNYHQHTNGNCRFFTALCKIQYYLQHHKLDSPTEINFYHLPLRLFSNFNLWFWMQTLNVPSRFWKLHTWNKGTCLDFQFLLFPFFISKGLAFCCIPHWARFYFHRIQFWISCNFMISILEDFSMRILTSSSRLLFAPTRNLRYWFEHNGEWACLLLGTVIFLFECIFRNNALPYLVLLPSRQPMFPTVTQHNLRMGSHPSLLPPTSL